MLATIPVEVWPAIESTVMDLMVSVFDAGYMSGAGLDWHDPTDNPTLAWLISETRRRWAEELRCGRLWTEPGAAEADTPPFPAVPPWLAQLQIGGGG